MSKLKNSSPDSAVAVQSQLLAPAEVMTACHPTVNLQLHLAAGLRMSAILLTQDGHTSLQICSYVVLGCSYVSREPIKVPSSPLQTPTLSWMVPLGAQISSASLSPPGSVDQLCSISSTPLRPNPSSSSSALLSWSSLIWSYFYTFLSCN